MTHNIKREYSGEGHRRGITPTCSCGWRGVRYESWQDYMMTAVARQEGEHLRQIAAMESRNER